MEYKEKIERAIQIIEKKEVKDRSDAEHHLLLLFKYNHSVRDYLLSMGDFKDDVSSTKSELKLGCGKLFYSKNDQRTYQCGKDQSFNGMVSKRIYCPKCKPQLKSGTTITDVKIVGLCSKCRKEGDDIPKNIHGEVWDDKDISCLNNAFGTCKGSIIKIKGCGKPLSNSFYAHFKCGETERLCEECLPHNKNVTEDKK